MPSLVPSNQQLIETLAALKAKINAGLGVRLFISDVSPVPGRFIDDYTEAQFPGYVRQTTAGTAGDPIKVYDGLYAINAGPFSWTPTADVDDPVYGWFIALGPVWYWAGRFDTPILPRAGVPIELSLQLQEGSLTLCGGNL